MVSLAYFCNYIEWLAPILLLITYVYVRTYMILQARLWVLSKIIYSFRKAHTKATQEWLDRLAQENVYVLVCLTYGDKLYAELMSKDGRHLNQAVAKSELQKQKEVSQLAM